MQIAIPNFYAEYSRYVARFRAFPSFIDGLLSVERRLLLILHQETKNKFIKSATITGLVAGKLHPHSPESIYDTLVKLVNQGFGSKEGGSWGTEGIDDSYASSQRYTEAKIEPWVSNLCMEYVDYVPWDFLELEKEPLYLPSPIPIGLVGDGLITGIAVGYKTMVPKYSIKDLKTRLLYLLGKEKVEPIIIPAKKDCQVKEFEKDAFKDILTTGRGSIVYIPNGNIVNETIEINKKKSKINVIKICGRAPNATFKSLKSAVADKKIGINRLVDLYDEKNNNIEIVCIPTSKDITDIKKTATKLWSTHLTKKINFNSFFHDLHGNVKEIGIDEVILNSFIHWKAAKQIKHISDLNNVNTSFIKNKVSSLLKEVISNNKNILNNFEEIYSKLNQNELFIYLDYYENDNYILKKIELEKKLIEDIYNSVPLKRIIESTDQKNKLDSELKNIKSEIDNLDSNCIELVKNI